MGSIVAAALALAFALLAPYVAAEEEAESAMEQFKAMDRDQDGKVTMDEILQGLDGVQDSMDEMIELQGDQDEKVTKVKDLLKVHFPAADANGDGFLEASEFPEPNQRMMKAFDGEEL